MKTNNPDNERIKREYFAYLKEANRFTEQSVDGVAKARNRFETYTRFRDFKKFHFEQTIAFKRHLADLPSSRTKESLSKATMYSTLAALKSFFKWLAGRPGFKSRLSYGDADYFNLSDNDTRIAKARREQPAPTVEQIVHVINAMPSVTAIERRNRALVAFILLTGARDGAVASLKLKHVDMAENVVHQYGGEVNTKRRKTFSTWFFPVGHDIRAIVANWIDFLQNELLWGMVDPLFPATRVALGANRLFEAAGLDRKHWANATPIRAIFKEAFTSAGLPAFPPHRVRKTLALLGERLCRNPEDFKAWSQNIGHEHVMTTLMAYGEVAPRRQAEIIRELARPHSGEGSFDRALIDIARALQAAGVSAPNR